MATRYPGALDRDPNELPDNIADSDTLDSPNHATVHNNVNGAVLQIEEKLGIGDTTASVGAVLHGTAAGESEWTSDPSIVGSLSVAKDSADAVINLTAHHDTEATAAELTLRKSDGSKASPALVDDDAVLGKIMFQGYDGNSYANGAQIRAQVDGTPADGDMPTEMIFMVTPDGGSETPATAMTISPDKKVTFAGATQHDSTLTVGVDDTGYDVIFYGATTSNGYAWWDESTDSFIVGPAGHLSFGETAPTWPVEFATDDDLTVFDSTSKGGVCILNSDYNANDYTALDFGYTGSDNPIGRIATRITSGGSELWFGTSDNYSNGITNSSVKITKDGYLKLGEATDYTLDTNMNGPLQFSWSGYTGGILGNTTGMFIGHNSAARTMSLVTNETERLRVMGDGRVAIRDDSTAGAITNRLLTLRSQPASMTGVLCWSEYDVGAANGTAGIFMLGDSGDSTNPDTGDYFILFRRGNGTTIGSVRGTGSASVNFLTTSDQTMKNDLGDAGDVGPLIDALKIHKYTWKDAKAEVGEQLGVFAQEVLDISGMPNGIATPAETRNEAVDTTTDEDGNEVDVKEDVYYPAGIDYGKLVPLLVQEIKSLRQRVATLEG